MQRNSSLSPSRARLALLASALLLVLLPDCDGRFAFDGPPVTAGNGSGGTSSEGGAGAAARGGAGAAVGSAGHAGQDPSSCDDDDDCGLASLHCNPSTKTCVECVSDRHCPDDRPACSTDTGRCVGCGATKACPHGQTCELESKKCLVDCNDDSECAGLHQYCDHSGECVTCDGNSDCIEKLGGTVCQVSAGVCLQCLDSSQCAGQTPLCLLPDGACVACRDSRDCPTTAPFCDPVAHVCSAAEH